MARRSPTLDRDLADLPPPLRWRSWMARVEAVLFAAAAPVERERLADLVGADCNLDLLIADIRAELSGRPYDVLAVAGGWQMRTRPAFRDVLQATLGPADGEQPLNATESLVLTAIAYFQPLTRSAIAEMIGRPVSRDTVGYLKGLGLIANGPRSPEPGAPFTYVTTRHFLSHFGFDNLGDLPEIDEAEARLAARQDTPAK